MHLIRGWIRIVTAVAVVVCCTVAMAFAARRLPAHARAAYRAVKQREHACLFCRLTGIHVTTKGPPPPPGPMLYVANHITALDPILIGSCVEVSFAGKTEITSWPVLGRIARVHNIIGVERARRSGAHRFVKAIRSRLACGIPVMVFPEGRIGWGDTLFPFKTGAFEAISGREDGLVQPVFMDIVAIDGEPVPGGEGRYVLSYNHHFYLSHHLAHVLSFRRIDVEVHFGPPFSACSLKRKALADLAHKAVLTLQEGTMVRA